MLWVEKLSLYHFKNYEQKEFLFDKKIIGLCGPNGVGKTNLLDALYFLCFTKSYFSRTDASAATGGAGGFRIEGFLKKGEENETCCCLTRETGKKEFSINNTLYNRFSDHIGRYPCIIIAPDDASLINGPGEERRRFLDTLLSQLDHTYLEQLIIYNKILQQRNAALKAYPAPSQLLNMLDVYDGQVAQAAQYITDARRAFLNTFSSEVATVYNDISQVGEDIALQYQPSIPHEAGALDFFKQHRQRDIQAQRSTTGPHRDDIEFTYAHGQSFKWIASQGQKKTMLFALKLAALDILKNHNGFSPLLLLDDVFEKLDGQRVRNLLHRVCTGDGQVFITDTDAHRLVEHIKQIGLDVQIISLMK